MAAISEAIEVGADGVEIDVRRSADDVLVLANDAIRPSGSLVRELTADELDDDVCTLVEALEVTADRFVNIEIKNSPTDPDYDAEHGISLAVAGLVAAFEAGERCLVSAFEPESLLRVRAFDPNIALGWITWGQADPASLVARAEFHELAAICPHHSQVDASFVKRAQASGLRVFVWTVNDASRAQELADLKVDAIITDDPSRIIGALRPSD